MNLHTLSKSQVYLSVGNILSALLLLVATVMFIPDFLKNIGLGIVSVPFLAIAYLIYLGLVVLSFRRRTTLSQVIGSLISVLVTPSLLGDIFGQLAPSKSGTLMYGLGVVLMGACFFDFVWRFRELSKTEGKNKKSNG